MAADAQPSPDLWERYRNSLDRQLCGGVTPGAVDESLVAGALETLRASHDILGHLPAHNVEDLYRLTLQRL